MQKIILLILVFITGANAFSQSLQINWQSCYGGTESDAAADIITSASGYFVAGSTSSNDGDISYLFGGQDWWLIKTDFLGNLQWEKTLGGSNGEHLLRIFKSEEYYYLLGSSYSSDGDISYDPYPESTDFWIVKTDSLGNIIWDRILGGNVLDQMWTGTLTNDGGVVAFGWTGSMDGDVTTYFGAYDMWMVKLNSQGEKEWDFTIGTDDFDYGQAIIQTNDGGFLVGGASTIGEGGNLSCEPFNYNAEAILVKLDVDLNIEWQQCYGGSDHDGITALVEVNDGYVFGSYVNSNDGDISGWHGENDIWVVKVDLFGNIVWQKCLGGSRSEFVSKLLTNNNEDIIIPGITQSNNGDVIGNHTLSEYDFDIWMVKLNSDGELVSQQCIGGDGDERMDFGIVKKGEDNFVIAGQTNWGPSFDVECNPYSAVTPDFWIYEIKDTTTNIINNQVENQLKVYPNPARDYVIFEFEVRNPPAGRTGLKFEIGESRQIRIMDIFGKEVALINLQNEKTIWEPQKLPQGIYFYFLLLDRNNLSGKIVIR